MKPDPQPSTDHIEKQSRKCSRKLHETPMYMCVDTYRHTCRHAVSERCRKYPLDPPSMCGPRLMAFHPILSGLLPLQCRPPNIHHTHTYTHTKTMSSRIPSSCMQLSYYYLSREAETSPIYMHTCTIYVQSYMCMNPLYVDACLPARNPEFRACARCVCVC